MKIDIKKFEQLNLKPNCKTMEEVVEYIEENWKAERVKISATDYALHFKAAFDFYKQLGKDPTGIDEEIRRYQLPNKIYLILGMKTEYLTSENGLKYYQALQTLKGLSEEDIKTKNARWLQYCILLDLQKDWISKEEEYKQLKGDN